MGMLVVDGIFSVAAFGGRGSSDELLADRSCGGGSAPLADKGFAIRL